MNGVSRMTKRPGDPGNITPFLAGVVLGAICVALNNSTETELGTYLAATVLLGAVLTSGTAIMNLTLTIIGL